MKLVMPGNAKGLKLLCHGHVMGLVPGVVQLYEGMPALVVAGEGMPAPVPVSVTVLPGKTVTLELGR